MDLCAKRFKRIYYVLPPTLLRRWLSYEMLNAHYTQGYGERKSSVISIGVFEVRLMSASNIPYVQTNDWS